MRRIAALTVVTLVCSGVCAFGAVGGISLGAAGGSLPPTTYVALPATPPGLRVDRPDVYAYVSDEHIAGRQVASSSSGPVAPGDTESAAVTVTGSVMPVRTIVVDDAGTVVEVWSNTEDPRGRRSLYTVRRGSDTGPPVALTEQIWSQAREIIATTKPGIGRVYPDG